MKLDPKEVLLQLVSLGTSDEKYGWISTLVAKALSDAAVATVEELQDQDRDSLIDEIKLGFGENGQDVPDFLKDDTGDDVTLKSTLPDNANTLPDPNGAQVVAKLEADLAEANQKLAESEKRLEVAKTFLQQIDEKLSKYEALDIDEIAETLMKYEALGTIDQFVEFKAKVESTLNPEAGQSATDKLINKGDGMSEKTNAKNEGEDDVEALKAQLAKYQALGTVEEIEDLVGRSEQLLSDNADLSDKVESTKNELAKYESIGSVDEILGVVEEYATAKKKSESERIATTLSIPVEKVVETIDKMESVQAAEALLTTLFAKTEAEKEAEAALAAKAKQEAEEAEAAALAAKQKAEGAEVEGATLVNDKNQKEVKQLPKTEARMTVLRELCAKL